MYKINAQLPLADGGKQRPLGYSSGDHLPARPRQGKWFSFPRDFLAMSPLLVGIWREHVGAVKEALQIGIADLCALHHLLML